jgi:hexosaminidase
MTRKSSKKSTTLAALTILASTATPSLALWPLPRQFTSGNSTLKLSNSFSIDLSSLPGGAPQDLQDAVARTQGFLASDALEPLVPDRGASIDVSSSPSLAYLVLSLSSDACAPIADEAQKPVEERSEGYVLSVPADGSNATLQANSTLGLYRGLTTFGQLWYTSNGATYATEAPLDAQDEPAYPYRGFMLDTARNLYVFPFPPFRISF